MADIVEFYADDGLRIGTLAERDKQRLTVVDPRGRRHRVAPERVLFRHSGQSADAVLETIESRAEEVDIELLWEAVRSEGEPQPSDAAALARLFFDRDDAASASAIYRALSADGLYFRRRGSAFSPRSEAELEQVRRMRLAEQAAAEELTQIQAGLRRKPIDADLAGRIEARIRGRSDRLLDQALAETTSDPLRHAFCLLLQGGYVDATLDYEVMAANLKESFPEAVLQHAGAIQLPQQSAAAWESWLAIDDPDTREVDDAISISHEAELIRIDIDIANAAAFVQRGDPVDREAERRGATVYLPTRRYYMLPESIGCEAASLQPDHERPVMRTSVWLDADGNIKRRALQEGWTRVRRRLDYESADRLLANANDPSGEPLRLLAQLAERLREQRRRAGALSIQRPEWKVSVRQGGEQITVTPIDPNSTSRRLVGELMVLANATAAQIARDAELPLLYRLQPTPKDPLPPLEPDDPLAFLRLRGRISPATLSLDPGKHFGLGLEAYTQVTSPLRRYADLVQQRQLLAHLSGETPPYQRADLLEVMAAIESVDQELRRLESATTQRWILEYVSRLPSRKGLAARVTAEVAGGAKVVLLESGAEGLLSLRGSAPALGSELTVDIDRINPRRGTLRLVRSRQA
jgi:exoribonuclease-2